MPPRITCLTMSDISLEAFTSAPFAARIGKALTVEAAEGELTLEVFSVKENPLSAGPNARRTPFSVTLRGPDSPCLSDGCFNLRADGEDGWRLDGIYINRIVPSAHSDGAGAFYQAVFS
jgi:hypothetical protein